MHVEGATEARNKDTYNITMLQFCGTKYDAVVSSKNLLKILIHKGFYCNRISTTELVKV